MAIIELMDCLDPTGRYLKNTSAQISMGINHGNKPSTELAAIINFKERKKRLSQGNQWT